MIAPDELEPHEERRGPHDNLYQWQPFGPGANGRFQKPHWWEEAGDWPMRGGWFFLVWLDGVEVARVKLNDNGIGAWDDFGAPPLERAHGGLQIERFEVAADHHRRGVGTAAVHALGAHFPDRRLAAYAMDDAERFWGSLGWDRYDRDERSDPLFVQPIGR